ncbi:DNA segregation ATPase FtsK/SpoIIIE [Bacteroidales bacterium 6E]|nr:DNA segregation ATPase FtsK/SpoIIIE [Bacteroidales bacterium 6E]
MVANTRKTVRNTKPAKERKPFLAAFRDQRFSFILGILLLAFTFYLTIAFISFIFSGDADQSKLELKWSELVFKSDIKVENKAGKTGAFLADVIINQAFGVASFIFIYILGLIGFRLIGRKRDTFYRNFTFAVLSIIWLSVMLGYIFMKTDGGSFIYLGGKYGFVAAIWLNSLVGKIGTLLILLAMAFVTVGVFFKSSIPWMIEKMKPREKPAKKPKDERHEDEEFDEEESVLQPEYIAPISKVIDNEDVVKAIFDPDGESDDHEHVRMEVDKGEPLVDHPAPVEAEVHHDDLLEIENPDEEEFVGDSTLPDYDPTLELSSFKLPVLDLLDDHHHGNAEVSNEELISNKNKIVETLRHYKIEITKIRATIGPTITLYEIIPAPGIRIAKIKNLEDDIALSLSALGIRIIAPIPGRGTIGIEVPNQNPEVVSMKSILGSKKFVESTAELPVALGKTISNETYMFDLVKMPHILVAGATGQGKSVGLNVIIASLLYKKHPSELKFVFVDPKKVELNLYSVIEKHYLAKLPDEDEPIITDIQKVKATLASLTVEMDTRYDLLKKAHARNVKEYNEKFIKRRLNPEKGHRYLPYIVVIIDEFADLIMTAGKEIELPIARIAQLARAVGIHMIIATQRPSINIITGVIKANFPARIAFKVASMIDSRTILDTPGANQLIGKGDMLISSGSAVTRVQCAFLDTPEVENICKYIADQRGFPTAFLLPEVEGGEEGVLDTDLTEKDELFDDAARLVVLNQMGSTSMIQRKLAIGYNRAGRIMDQLEVAGIVGPSEGSKARQVLLQDEYALEQLLNTLR